MSAEPLTNPDTPACSTGVPGLDRVLGGGLPLYSAVILAGPPGAGKTILSQQVGYHHARRGAGRVLFLTALSEPRGKVIRNVQRFRFFDPGVFGREVRYEEVGPLLHDRTPPEAVGVVLQLVEDHRADLLVLDSFRAILELPGVARAGRVFCHDLCERLGFARCTALLVGEYDGSEEDVRPEWAVADGVLLLGMRESAAGVTRTLQVRKLRGHAADLRTHPVEIGEAGVVILPPGPTGPTRGGRRSAGPEAARIDSPPSRTRVWPRAEAMPRGPILYPS